MFRPYQPPDEEKFDDFSLRETFQGYKWIYLSLLALIFAYYWQQEDINIIYLLISSFLSLLFAIFCPAYLAGQLCRALEGTAMITTFIWALKFKSGEVVGALIEVGITAVCRVLYWLTSSSKLNRQMISLAEGARGYWNSEERAQKAQKAQRGIYHRRMIYLMVNSLLICTVTCNLLKAEPWNYESVKIDNIMGEITSIYTQVSSTQDEVSHLNKSMNSLTEEVSSIEKDVKNLTSEVSGLKKEVKSVSDEVSGLKEEVKSISDEVSGLKKEVKSVSDEVSGLKKEVKSVSYEVSGLKIEVKSIKDEVSDLKNDMTNIDKKTDEIIKILNNLTAKKE